MTAINAFLRRDRGFLMADGAFYTATGVPMGFGNKIVQIPELRAAVAARGYAGIAPALAQGFLATYRTFDDLAEGAQSALAEWAEQNAPMLELFGFPDFEFHVMGWSEKLGRPRHFVFAYRPGAEGDRALVETTDLVLCPSLDDAEAFETLPKLGVYVMHPQFAETFDPERDGVPIMVSQRRQLDELDGHDEVGRVCIVGGHVEVVEISADGVSQRIVHRWSDEAGTIVEPEALSSRDVLRARIQRRNAALTREVA